MSAHRHPLALALPVVLAATLLWPGLAPAQDLVSHLPAGGAVVISVDLAKLMANAELKKLVDEQLAAARQAKIPGLMELDEAVKILQFDPLKDLRQLAVLMPAPGPDGRPPDEGLALFRGAFQKEAMVAALEKDESFKVDGKIDTFEGLTAIRATGKPDFAVFLAPDLVAVGNEARLKEAIAVQNGKGAALPASPGFADLVKRVPPGTPIWIGAALPPETRQQIALAASDTPYAAVGRMTDLLLTIDITTTIEARLQVRADTPEAAGTIGSAIEGTIAQARLNATGAPAEWVKLLNGFTFKADGPVAIVGLSYPLAEVKGLVLPILGIATSAGTASGPEGTSGPSMSPPADTDPEMPPTDDDEEGAEEGDQEGDGGSDT